MKLSCRFWGAVPSGSGRVAQAVPSGPVTPKSALRLSSFLGRPAWKMCKKNQESTFFFGCHSDVWVQREHLRLPRILNFTSQKFKTWTNECLHKRQKKSPKEPSWCLLWSYWHANVALQSIPPLPWFCRDSSQHEAFESNFFCGILKFWAMAEINNWIATNKPHKNF